MVIVAASTMAFLIHTYSSFVIASLHVDALLRCDGITRRDGIVACVGILMPCMPDTFHITIIRTASF